MSVTKRGILSEEGRDAWILVRSNKWHGRRCKESGIAGGISRYRVETWGAAERRKRRRR
jgi:hypothetical protein